MTTNHDREATSPVSALGRLFWMMLGPMLLVMLAVGIVRTGNGWLTPVDFAFLGVLGGMMFARWLEFRGGTPRTSTGAPATPANLRHYIAGTLLFGLSAFALANVVGNYVFNG